MSDEEGSQPHCKQIRKISGACCVVESLAPLKSWRFLPGAWSTKIQEDGASVALPIGKSPLIISNKHLEDVKRCAKREKRPRVEVS